MRRVQVDIACRYVLLKDVHSSVTWKRNCTKCGFNPTVDVLSWQYCFELSNVLYQGLGLGQVERPIKQQNLDKEEYGKAQE